MASFTKNNVDKPRTLTSRAILCVQHTTYPDQDNKETQEGLEKIQIISRTTYTPVHIDTGLSSINMTELLAVILSLEMITLAACSIFI